MPRIVRLSQLARSSSPRERDGCEGTARGTEREGWDVGQRAARRGWRTGSGNFHWGSRGHGEGSRAGGSGGLRAADGGLRPATTAPHRTVRPALCLGQGRDPVNSQHTDLPPGGQGGGSPVTLTHCKLPSPSGRSHWPLRPRHELWSIHLSWTASGATLNSTFLPQTQLWLGNKPHPEVTAWAWQSVYSLEPAPEAVRKLVATQNQIVLVSKEE